MDLTQLLQKTFVVLEQQSPLPAVEILVGHAHGCGSDTMKLCGKKTFVCIVLNQQLSFPAWM